MRRPASTREQKKHARWQRAARALVRAAVRYSNGSEQNADALGLLFADLTIACDRVTVLLTARERKRLCK